MQTKGAFEIPKIEEVIAYMNCKWKDWPAKFCEYYANRFWNHYQSNGWLVSGKAKMKDWKAAVNGQWSTIKFKEDKDMLDKLLSEWTKEQYSKKSVPENNDRDTKKFDTVEYMDEILRQYVKHPALMPIETLASCYDWLKENRMVKLSPEQKEISISQYQKNQMKGRAIAVGFIFDSIANSLKTFKEIFNASVAG